MSHTEAPTERSFVKGLIAGLIGGLVATAVKTLSERVYPPRVHGEPEPPDVLVDKIVGHPLEGTEKTVATEAIHWGFGAAAGAVYGVLAEFYPAATAKEGASFGLALMTLTHESALPSMGLSAPPDEQTPREHTSEAASHILYGVTAERVRSMVRPMLD